MINEAALFAAELLFLALIALCMMIAEGWYERWNNRRVYAGEVERVEAVESKLDRPTALPRACMYLPERAEQITPKDHAGIWNESVYAATEGQAVQI